MHIIPHNLLSDERMWAHSCCLTPPRSRTGTTGWGAWRMLWWVREWSRPSSPSQLWVAGPLSPYNVIIYLFCIELLLYSKVVTFDPVPWFIIRVRLGPSTPGDYVRARVLVPLKPGCDRSGIRGMLTVGRNLDRNGQNHYLLTLLWFFSKLFLIFSHLFPLYSDYPYLFLLKTNVDFTPWNLVPKVTFRNRRPALRNKNKIIFIDIYAFECLFLWYFFDLDLWLSVMSCGVMSTITSAYTYMYKYK
jgi:hypothetical protein